MGGEATPPMPTAVSVCWPPARARWLHADAMEHFRRSYRNYRLGRPKGAKGELIDVVEIGGKYGGGKLHDVSSRQRDATSIKEISIFQETCEDPEYITNTKQLEQYRRAYRRFRTGAAQGAEGEVSRLAKRFTKDQLRLLPIAQLARCLADQVEDISPAHPTFHCHFGAGKLGLGLVLPALVASHIPFAVLQRPSDAWAAVLESSDEKLAVEVNGERVCELLVIRSIDDVPKTWVVAEENDTTATFCPPASRSCQLLVLDPSLLGMFCNAADSFSCALGPALAPTLRPISQLLPANSGLRRPALYACENDHKAVDGIREDFDAPLFVRECMVDRICSERVIKKGKIEVTAEPYPGEIVVTARHRTAVAPALGGPNVRTPQTTGAYSYLYARKFLLVNGTHTTLAFMTLRARCADPADVPGDFELLSPEDMSGAEREELRAWAAARCLVLLHSHEVQVIKVAHRVESDEAVVQRLWEYAQTTMKRFSTVKDSTKRVLGGGVANRYETRLKDVLETLETFTSVPLGSRLLAEAKFQSMSQLRNILRKLVRDAHRFVDHEDRPAGGEWFKQKTVSRNFFLNAIDKAFAGRAK